jgi:NRPS condensation-like uncharacterized protein
MEHRTKGGPVAEEPYPYRLDNAALIFPGMLSPRRTTIFRLAASIDEAVVISRLQAAVDTMMERCPYYRVDLRRGVFWYYLEYCDTPVAVEAESRYPCMYIPFKRRGVLPLRVIAFRNRIALEISHILTDGTGALAFLNGLLVEYFRLRGDDVDPEKTLLDPHGPIDPQEYEDSFHKEYRKGVPPADRKDRALHFGGSAVKPPIFYVIEGILDSNQLHGYAREKGVTVGEFLTALMIDVAREEMLARKLSPKPIRIAIPINLRQFFPSRTMRNFVLSVEPGIDPRLGDFSFDDILAKVHHFMRTELDHRFIRRQIVRNLKSEKNPFIRIVPRVIKDPILRWAYSAFGTSIFTIGFSNLGRVRIPETMQPRIESYQFIPPPHNNALNATSISYGGKTRIVFAGTTQDTPLERRFFRRLRAMGLAVSIRTNRR